MAIKRQSERGPRRRTDASLADVARLAGVSAATVSRALHSPELLSETTLRRVHAAIAESRYVPALVTGRVMSNRTRLVAMLLPPTPLALFDATAKALVVDLDTAGFQTLIVFHRREEGQERLVTELLSRRPSALVLVGLPLPSELRERMHGAAIPVIETWEMPSDPIDMVCGVSHQAIGRELGRFILKGGYCRPFFLTNGSYRGLERRYCANQVLREAGLEEPGHIDHSFPGTVGDGRRSFVRAMDVGNLPDLIVCSSDLLAQGVLIEAAKRGIRIPEDVSVIGFGDLDFARDLEPSLTTIRIDGAEIGHQSAKLILGRLAGDTRPHRLDVGFSIVERNSTRVLQEKSRAKAREAPSAN